MARDEGQARERFRMVLELYDLGERMLRQSLRRKLPDAGDGEIEAMVERWLRHRPGAELGDGEGTAVDWPR